MTLSLPVMPSLTQPSILLPARWSLMSSLLSTRTLRSLATDLQDVKVQSFCVSFSFIWPLAESNPKNLLSGSTNWSYSYTVTCHCHYLLPTYLFPTLLLPAQSHSATKHRYPLRAYKN